MEYCRSIDDELPPSNHTHHGKRKRKRKLLINEYGFQFLRKSNSSHLLIGVAAVGRAEEEATRELKIDEVLSMIERLRKDDFIGIIVDFSVDTEVEEFRGS
ncbi:hypothetical protein L2E82_46171 [Cichorium intybus]|uniref:Uncharacterized protein n=1 Tax=Cichorium intybus TaxID=13427 RepID=A0ACB8YSM6_CICIN|nr:hypothetical protein L2E82_46171 [Cichorium intybus]